MKTDTGFEVEKIKDLPMTPTGATQVVWKVDPPIKFDGGETPYVITSAVNAMFSGYETYIFPALEIDGEIDICSWGELPGSYRGDLDHERAINYVNHYEEY